MDKVNDGGPAFPAMTTLDEKLMCIAQGMTLRDYFAAKAMAAGIQNGPFANDRNDGEKYHAYLARKAYEMADAMLAARGAQ